MSASATPETGAKTLTITIDGKPVQVREGATLLDAIRSQGVDTPTLCYIETLTPVNVCRVCVVEVEGCAWWLVLVAAGADVAFVVDLDLPASAFALV